MNHGKYKMSTYHLLTGVRVFYKIGTEASFPEAWNRPLTSMKHRG